ncbi:hypothetical protein DRW41_15265 [Neobacillus piezotolerans]|uniref:Uncharacterized protein n=1 Tax=Neobacillus piezotolerans TaxID=2259171 RepID=A0A3D8GNT5_9BACI|nr:hypothetical protein DRW41_15265 [Neobacillus piezotolerans]
MTVFDIMHEIIDKYKKVGDKIKKISISGPKPSITFHKPKNGKIFHKLVVKFGRFIQKLLE